ncbi:blue light receptor [Irineochytrium annulatum]|nr:blue light receptor [Irineochytrium annulatum]
MQHAKYRGPVQQGRAGEASHQSQQQRQTEASNRSSAGSAAEAIMPGRRGPNESAGQSGTSSGSTKDRQAVAEPRRVWAGGGGPSSFTSGDSMGQLVGGSALFGAQGAGEGTGAVADLQRLHRAQREMLKHVQEREMDEITYSGSVTGPAGARAKSGHDSSATCTTRDRRKHENSVRASSAFPIAPSAVLDELSSWTDFNASNVTAKGNTLVSDRPDFSGVYDGEQDRLPVSSLEAPPVLTDGVESSDNVISMFMSMMEKDPTISSPMLDLDGKGLFQTVVDSDGFAGQAGDLKGFGVEDNWSIEGRRATSMATNYRANLNANNKRPPSSRSSDISSGSDIDGVVEDAGQMMSRLMAASKDGGTNAKAMQDVADPHGAVADCEYTTPSSPQGLDAGYYETMAANSAMAHHRRFGAARGSSVVGSPQGYSDDMHQYQLHSPLVVSAVDPADQHPGYYSYNYNFSGGDPSCLSNLSAIPSTHLQHITTSPLQQQEVTRGPLSAKQERAQLRENQQFFAEHSYRTNAPRRTSDDDGAGRTQHHHHHHHHHHHLDADGHETVTTDVHIIEDGESVSYPFEHASHMEPQRTRERSTSSSAGSGRSLKSASLASTGIGGGPMTALNVMNLREVHDLNKAVNAFQDQQKAGAANSSGQLNLGGGPGDVDGDGAVVTLEHLAKKVQDSAAEVMATVQALRKERSEGGVAVGTKGSNVAVVVSEIMVPAMPTSAASAERSIVTPQLETAAVRSPQQLSQKQSDTRIVVELTTNTAHALTSAQPEKGGKLGGDGGEAREKQGNTVSNLLTGNTAAFSKLIPHLDDLLLALGRDTTILYASPSAIHYLKAPPEQLAGKKLKDLVVDDDIQVVVNAIEKGFDNGTGFTIYIRVKEVTGTISSSASSNLEEGRPFSIFAAANHDAASPAHLGRQDVLELLGRPVVDAATGTVVYMLEVGRSYTQQSQQDHEWASRLENARLKALLEEELRMRGVDPRGHPLLDNNDKGCGQEKVVEEAAVAAKGRLKPPPMVPLTAATEVSGLNLGGSGKSRSSAGFVGGLTAPFGWPPIAGPANANVISTSLTAALSAAREGPAVKPPRKKVKIPKEELFCRRCGTTTSPEWRKGPEGPKTLCNACGLAHSKKQRKDLTTTQGAAAATVSAAASFPTPSSASSATSLPSFPTSTSIPPPNKVAIPASKHLINTASQMVVAPPALSSATAMQGVELSPKSVVLSPSPILNDVDASLQIEQDVANQPRQADVPLSTSGEFHIKTEGAMEVTGLRNYGGVWGYERGEYARGQYSMHLQSARMQNEGWSHGPAQMQQQPGYYPQQHHEQHRHYQQQQEHARYYEDQQRQQQQQDHQQQHRQNQQQYSHLPRDSMPWNR